MGKIKRFLLVFILTLVIGGIVLYSLSVPSWSYDLPNGYKIRKDKRQNVVLGVDVNGDFITKEYGIEEYIAQFQFNDNFVGVKTLVLDGMDSVVHFYLVDTKEKELHGPYYDEETYLAVVGVWSSESLGQWITTTEIPDGAKSR